MLISVISIYLLTGVHANFVPIFIETLLLLGGINIGSILFYKVLNTQDEILKYVFSFVHIVAVITFSISISSLM